jgi:hypothetical protein
MFGSPSTASTRCEQPHLERPDVGRLQLELALRAADLDRAPVDLREELVAVARDDVHDLELRRPRRRRPTRSAAPP